MLKQLLMKNLKTIRRILLLLSCKTEDRVSRGQILPPKRNPNQDQSLRKTLLEKRFLFPLRHDQLLPIMFLVEISQRTVILIEISQTKAKTPEVQKDIVTIGITRGTVLLEIAYFCMRNHRSVILMGIVIGKNACILM